MTGRRTVTHMKSADTENTELLSRIAQGDEAAFSAKFLTTSLRTASFSLVYKMLNDE